MHFSLQFFSIFSRMCSKTFWKFHGTSKTRSGMEPQRISADQTPGHACSVENFSNDPRIVGGATAQDFKKNAFCRMRYSRVISSRHFLLSAWWKFNSKLTRILLLSDLFISKVLFMREKLNTSFKKLLYVLTLFTITRYIPIKWLYRNCVHVKITFFQKMNNYN